MLFVLLILGNDVVLNGVLVLGTEEEIAFLQRSRFYAVLDTRAIFSSYLTEMFFGTHTVRYPEA